MKFVEMYLGELVNVDHIAHVYSENTERSRLISYLVTKNGKYFEFLEVPEVFNVDENGDKLIFDHKCLDVWHSHALEEIVHSKKTIIKSEELMNTTWEKFIKDHRKYLEKCAR